MHRCLSANLAIAKLDESAIGLVLQSFHLDHAFILSLPVSIRVHEDGSKRVVATAEIAQGELMLPPCVPKNPRVVKDCNSPLRIPIEISHSQSRSTTVVPSGSAVSGMATAVFSEPRS